MKTAAPLIVLTLFILFSCMPKEEVLHTRYVPAPSPAPETEITVGPEPVIPLPVPVYEEQIRCEDNTRATFNSCGLDILPFLRPVFFDMDNDGIQEMIAGSKDGTLRLYKNKGTREEPEWILIEHYFDGIKAGAFSAPAVGDIDGDGRPEVIVGTGGFSSDSGRVLIYRNIGSVISPVWEPIEGLNISVGNDATPALFDIDNDGRPDLVIGNSTGGLLLYRNRSDNRKIAFVKDAAFFRGIKAGMYAVPAVASRGDSLIVVIGDSMGKLSLFERSKTGNQKWSRSSLKMILQNFSAPTFIATEDPHRKDMVVSDGNGRLYYFRNKKGSFHEWEEAPDYFSGRILPGPACTPSVAENKGRRFMVTGNINGSIKLFEYDPGPKKLPWKEKIDFFKGIKLSGFSKGVMTEWNGKDLLITGQQDGLLKAFVRSGSPEKPVWTEKQGFFKGIGKIMHASPAIFDIDGDGSWQLIVGDADGYVHGFRYRLNNGTSGISGIGLPEWEEMSGPFKYVKVDHYASPSIFREGSRLYLLAGQQDGKIVVFTGETGRNQAPVFIRHDYLHGVRVDNHSSPAVISRNGLIELSVGDYNGSLRQFACRKVDVQVNSY
jgi:hypothetical protein